MTRWPELERFLATDPKDVGCDEAMAVLHVYADVMVRGEDPEVLYGEGIGSSYQGQVDTLGKHFRRTAG